MITLESGLSFGMRMGKRFVSADVQLFLILPPTLKIPSSIKGLSCERYFSVVLDVHSVSRQSLRNVVLAPNEQCLQEPFVET